MDDWEEEDFYAQDEEYLQQFQGESVVSDEDFLFPLINESEFQGSSVVEDSTFDIVPFASRAISWSYPNSVGSSSSSSLNLSGYFKSWNVWRFDPVLGDTNNIRNMAHNIDMILNQAKNSFAALELNESKIASELYYIRDEHLGWINKLWDWETTGRARVNNLWTWSSTVDSKNATQDGYINQLWDWQTTGRTRVNSLWDWSIDVAGILKRQDETLSKIKVTDDEQTSYINGLWSWSYTVDDRIKNLQTFESVANSSITDLKNWRTGATKSLTDLRSDVNGLWTWSYTVDDRIKNLQTFESVANTSINNHENRIKSIENWNLTDMIDLAIVVHAIDVVRDRTIDVKTAVDSLKTTLIAQILLVTNALSGIKTEIVNFANLFKANGAFQTFLTGTIKSQTLAIVDGLAMVDETIKTTFSNYFTDSKNGIFWVAYKKFSDFQMTVFFGVLFETLREDWDKNWTEILITWNLTNDLLLLNNDWSEIINNWLDLINTKLINTNDILAIVTNWLKLIYEKPIPTFNVPVFDYARLEKMLKKLEFGEITNEAGTNIWDFLKELVKGLTDSFKGILDFLDSLLDKLIALLIPENMDFLTASFEQVKLKFDVKFSGFLSLADDIKEMFQPIQKDVGSELTFDFLGVKFKPEMSILDSFVPKFRGLAALMLWFHTGWYVFRRFTGGGDLINDN